jgi:hypothetical protein
LREGKTSAVVPGHLALGELVFPERFQSFSRAITFVNFSILIELFYIFTING